MERGSRWILYSSFQLLLRATVADAFIFFFHFFHFPVSDDFYVQIYFLFYFIFNFRDLGVLCYILLESECCKDFLDFLFFV